MLNDPLNFIYNLAYDQYPSCTKFFHPNTSPDFLSLESIKRQVPFINGSKFQYYIAINPSLSTHSMYREKLEIPEFKRITLTRLRLSSHNLKIETGRWKCPPLPLHLRLCQCGDYTQDEKHIIETCYISENIRMQYPHIEFTSKNILNDIHHKT